MLETLTLTSNLGPRFELGPETVRRWDGSVETAVALINVVRVRMMVVGGGGAIELTAGERELVIVSDRAHGRGSPRLPEPVRGHYRAFVVELHRRLIATGEAVDYLGGTIFKKRYDPSAIPETLFP